MSVLIGLILQGVTILATDRRMIDTVAHSITSEDHSKVFVFNNRVSISILGNAASAMLIREMIEKVKDSAPGNTINTLYVEHCCDLVDHALGELRKSFPNQQEVMPCVMAVAGEQANHLQTICWKTDEWADWSSCDEILGKMVPVILQPPELSYEECKETLITALDRRKQIDGDPVLGIVDAIRTIATKAFSVNGRITIWKSDEDGLMIL